MTRFRELLAATLTMVLASAAVSAQTQPAAGAAPTPAPTPCANDSERHRFDFWIGEWDVTVKSGGRAGSSSIQSVSGGCALLENWTGANGGHGKSLNAYNPSTRQWQQYWIGQDGAVSEFRTSKFDGKSLEFFTKDDANPSALTRLVFTPVDSVTVRQYSEASTDGGKSWKTQFDLYYHRKSN
jgi:opacity protein-like surface antigen